MAFFGGIAEGGLGTAVPGKDVASGIAGDDGILGALDDGREQGLRFLGRAAAGDVVPGRDITDNRTTGVADRRDAHFLVIEGAILAAVHHFSVPDLSRLEVVPKIPVECSGLATRFEDARELAYGFLAAVASEGREGGIYILDSARGIGDDDAICGLLDGCRQGSLLDRRTFRLHLGTSLMHIVRIGRFLR